MVDFHPGKSGIWFRCGSERLEARPENVADTTRCTKVGSIATVEHAMAALAGCGITDGEFELSAPEFPALDGSAKIFAEQFLLAGFEELDAKEANDLFARVFVQESEAKLAISAGTGHWRYEFFSAEHWPRFQQYETADVAADFAQEIAPARTFGFEFEIAAIRAAGLAQGLDYDSALVIGADSYANPARFPDEPARHKLLDAIGDVYLAGVPIACLNLVAQRTGHRMNVEAAHRLQMAWIG